MRFMLIPLLAVVFTAVPLHAQDTTSDLEGRFVRVWPEGAMSPITGRVAAVTESTLTLGTGEPYCGPAGCIRAFSVDWPNVSRIQVGRLSTTERAIRAGLAGLGLALLMGPGLSSCEGRNREGCQGLVFAASGAVGVGAYFFTRQSWEDVSVPDSH